MGQYLAGRWTSGKWWLVVLGLVLAPTAWAVNGSVENAAPEDADTAALVIELRFEDPAPAEAGAILRFARRAEDGSEMKTVRAVRLHTGMNKIRTSWMRDGSYRLCIDKDKSWLPWTGRGEVRGGVMAMECGASATIITLYHVRYVTVEYAINACNERELTGANVWMNRVVCINYVGLDGFVEDWWFSQGEEGQYSDKVMMKFRPCVPRGFGFIPIAHNREFWSIPTAPDPLAETYMPVSVEAKRGLMLFGRVYGGDPGGKYFGKLRIVDVSIERPECYVDPIPYEELRKRAGCDGTCDVKPQ